MVFLAKKYGIFGKFSKKAVFPKKVVLEYDLPYITRKDVISFS